jgi:hypothetical protein
VGLDLEGKGAVGGGTVVCELDGLIVFYEVGVLEVKVVEKDALLLPEVDMVEAHKHEAAEQRLGAVVEPPPQRLVWQVHLKKGHCVHRAHEQLAQ